MLKSVLLALPAIALLGCAQQQHVAYRFLLDGEKHEPSITTLHGATRLPRPGDLIWVAGHEFVLDDAADYYLESEGRHRLWRVFEDGRRELIALNFTGSEEDLALRAENWCTLRGLKVSNWSGAASERLNWLDPQRCLLELGVFVNFEKIPDFPPSLRYLDLAWTDLEDLAGIQRFADLRYLCVPRKQAVNSLGALRQLRELRYLKLEGSGVSDLSPLGGHPQLRRIEAPYAPVSVLPREPLPKLDSLIAYASGCPEVEARRFRALNPRTRLVVTFRQLLVDAVDGTVRLRIRTGSTCHPSDKDYQLYVTIDRNEIAELVGLLRTSEGYFRPMVVPGCGSYTFEFFDARGEMLLEVGLLGSSSLRSDRIWTMPGSLHKSTRAPLRQWMAARGIRQ